MQWLEPGCRQVVTRKYLSIYFILFCLWKCSRLKPYFNFCVIFIWPVSIARHGSFKTVLRRLLMVATFDSTVYFQKEGRYFF